MQTAVMEEKELSIEQQVWQLLKLGAANHKSPFHTGIVATSYDQTPFIRTVVLRDVDSIKKTLRFHTDIRSPKVLHITENPAISWLFYDKETRVQIRIQARAQVHQHDELANIAWEQSRVSARMCYTTSSGPGSPLEEPELIQFNLQKMTAEEEQFARQNFAIVLTQVQSIDVLFLHHSGHKRYLMDYEKNLNTWIQV